MVVTELRGEKIDIVPFSEDQADFVAKALSPAKVKEVRIHEDTGIAEVIVPDFQLSLAIGREGQNARLAARLTGWRVDIKSETQRAEEDAGIFRSDERYEREEGVEYAEGEWVPNADTGELEWHAADGTVVSAQEWAAGGETERARSGAEDRREGRRRRPSPPSPATARPRSPRTRPPRTRPPTKPPRTRSRSMRWRPARPTPRPRRLPVPRKRQPKLALDEEAAIEADLDPIQDAADAEAAERADEQE